MNFWIILPVKPLSEGKSRLASHLTPQQRYELNTFLLTRTLKLAHQFLPNQVLVVSRCQSVLSIANQWTAHTLIETVAGGLNAALAQASLWLKTMDVKNLLIIPTDLPRLTNKDLTSLVPLQPNQALIARDRAKQGTNALYWPTQAKIDYQFGEKSCLLHEIEANKAGLSVQFSDNPRLAFDLDTPTDYAEWIANDHVNKGLYL